MSCRRPSAPDDVARRDGDGQVTHAVRDVPHPTTVLLDPVGRSPPPDRLRGRKRQVVIGDLAEEGVADVDVLAAVPIAPVDRQDREPVAERHATRRRGEPATLDGRSDRKRHLDLGSRARRQRTRQRKLQHAAIRLPGYLLAVDGSPTKLERADHVRHDSKNQRRQRDADRIPIAKSLAHVDAAGVEVDGGI